MTFCDVMKCLLYLVHRPSLFRTLWPFGWLDPWRICPPPDLHTVHTNLISKSISHSTRIGQSVGQMVSHTVSHTVNRSSVSQLVSRSVSQLLSHSFIQPISQRLSQLVSQSAWQSISGAVCQSVSYLHQPVTLSTRTSSAWPWSVPQSVCQ